jgi:hypothetical protein
MNEVILSVALLFAAGSFIYKSKMRRSMALENQEMIQEIVVAKEISSLKKIWADKHIVQKLESVKTLFPSSKVTWSRRGKKLSARFSDLVPSEVNKVVSMILNIAVQIERFKVEKKGDKYNVEIQCKW